MTTFGIPPLFAYWERERISKREPVNADEPPAIRKKCRTYGGVSRIWQENPA